MLKCLNIKRQTIYNDYRLCDSQNSNISLFRFLENSEQAMADYCE